MQHPLRPSPPCNPSSMPSTSPSHRSYGPTETKRAPSRFSHPPVPYPRALPNHPVSVTRTHNAVEVQGGRQEGREKDRERRGAATPRAH
ncbi:hypothetical protein Trydic_g10952 [Trypoxylus dichotomus]